MDKQFVGIDEASKITGLSQYLLRKGVKSKRFPAFQLGRGGKYLLDLRQLVLILASEAMSNVQSRNADLNGTPNGVEKAENLLKF